MYLPMERERQRKRFTPMSGELKAMVDFEPHDPAQDELIIARGLRRLALILVLLGGAVTLAAWLYARHADEPIGDVLPVAFYIAAAGVGLFAVLGGTSGGWNVRAWGGGGYDRAQRAAAVNTSAVLAFLAIVLFGFGLVLDYLL